MATETSKWETRDYEVFLSFRGPDTRQGFTDCLYEFMDSAGIRVFRDDDELSIGQPIDTILLAIRNSKICIPIFSPSFASSAWCLREVAKMVELKKDIVPVFFGVMPDDVKLRTSVYGDDVAKHETKYGKDQVKKWADALKQILRLKGRELKDKGYCEFSKELTREVLTKLKTNKKHVPNHLLGVDDQVEEVLKLLDAESGGVRCVGIHGMGGVGKTTLAKVLFNKLAPTFDSCCFLADIRESSRRSGIENLQKDMLCMLDRRLRDITHNIDPIVMILERFCKEKVLVLLDDVSETEQIHGLVGETNRFASGSRIIVTTGDARVLRIGRKPFDGIFKVQGMTFSRGLQLFSCHAFGTASPPTESASLFEDVVRHCDGLPLALEVLGSLFGRTDESKWLETAKKLERVTDRRISDTLKISYEELEPEQQQIFLDIACFFINTEKSYVSYMWDACGFFPVLALDVLVSMSMIKIVEDDKLWMHDLLRDLGRQIVREGALQPPKCCSRLWEHCEDTMDILKTEDGKEGLVGLRLEGPCPSQIGDLLAGSQHLRFLSLNEAKFSKKFKHPLPQLKWLSMRQCPSSFSASHLNIRNLVILELPDSAISEKWEGWSHIEMVHLKVLDLTSCKKLKRTPDFSRIQNLEKLALRGCTNLVELHPSIVKLKNLNHLDLNHCSSLRELPEELGCLEKLDYMGLHGCAMLKSLPNSLKKLKSLAALDLSGKQDSLDKNFFVHNLMVGSMSSTDEDMDLSLMRDFFDHSALGQAKYTANVLKDSVLLGLRSLEEEIPNTFNYFKALQLPDIFSNLKELKKLDLSYISVRYLPESIGCLENLRELKAQRSFLVTLPKSIGRLKKLETLNMSQSLELAEIPEEIGGLSNLRTLNLSATSIRRLPSTITQISLLQSLYLGDCYELGKERRDSQLGQSSERVQPANALLTSFGDFSQLEVLELSCEYLKCIPPLPCSLRRLVLGRFTPGLKLPDTSRTKNLTYLCISFFGEPSEDETLACLPESLRELRLFFPNALPDLSNLKNLRKLVLQGGQSLKEIPGLAKLESLEELDICKCESLESLESLSELKNLKYVSILYSPKLSGVEGLDRLPLVEKDVHLGDCKCAQCLAEKRPPRRRQLVSWLQSKVGLPDSDDLLPLRHYLQSKVLMAMED